MTQKPTIRFARPKDVPQLVDLCQQHAAFEKCDYSIVGKSALLQKALFSEPPELFCLVVELKDKLIGYATYMKQYSTWDAEHYIYMDCLFLTDTARGYGIGEKLINRIKKEAVRLHCSLIQWQTPEFNTRAMKFYDRLGTESKKKKRYFLAIEK